jgi:hypothetical protein
MIAHDRINSMEQEKTFTKPPEKSKASNVTKFQFANNFLKFFYVTSPEHIDS